MTLSVSSIFSVLPLRGSVATVHLDGLAVAHDQVLLCLILPNDRFFELTTGGSSLSFCGAIDWHRNVALNPRAFQSQSEAEPSVLEVICRAVQIRSDIDVL